MALASVCLLVAVLLLIALRPRAAALPERAARMVARGVLEAADLDLALTLVARRLLRDKVMLAAPGPPEPMMAVAVAVERVAPEEMPRMAVLLVMVAPGQIHRL